jgi:hypothetical protein
VVIDSSDYSKRAEYKTHRNKTFIDSYFQRQISIAH